MSFDGQAFGREIVAAVKSHLAAALSPLLERLAAVELRAAEPVKGDKGEPGEKGQKGDPGSPGEKGEVGTPGERGEAGAKGEPGGQGPPGAPGLDGAPGTHGKDDIGLAGAVIDRKGHLVVTLTDGTTRELGPVAGRDGTDGKDGERGAPGADGVGFDDLDVVHDGERGFTLRFSRGETVKEFSFALPVMIYRGVHRDGSGYARGDTVTLGGSLWHCNDETAEKPGDGVKSWTLAAKRGRDGKEGAPGAKGDQGRPGRDLTRADMR